MAILGSAGSFLSTIGITARIASELKISLATELTDQLAQFAGSSSENFHNRSEIHGCFSPETLTRLTRALALAGLRPTATISGLIEGRNIGLKIKSIPGFGYRRGGGGVLTKGIEGKFEVIHTIRRIPRAFPNNVISVYDPDLAAAQRLIAGAAGVTERVRVAVKCHRTNRLVCFTDTGVFVVAASIAEAYKIKDFVGSQLQGLQLEMSFGRTNRLRINVPDEKTGCDIAWYIESQSRMLQVFDESLLP
jgi:hypothetical protein